MDALILFSHGALLCGSGEALQWHAGRLRARGGYAAVEIGYLNYSRPPFEQAVRRCVEAGATRIVVAPYFLAPGKFVSEDLPRQIDAAWSRCQGVEFLVAPPIGHDPALAGAILTLAAEARPRDRWRVDLARAAELCEAEPSCPLFGSGQCGGGLTNDERPTMHDGHASVVGRWSLVAEDSSSVAGPVSTLNPQPSTAQLVLIHGSPRPAANGPMYEVVEEVRQRGVYPIVEVGFLECNEPDIPTAIERCIAAGARRIVAVPYFLHTGSHVADDLPTLLEAAQDRHPAVEFLLGEFLGRAPEITDILAERAASVREPVEA